MVGAPQAVRDAASETLRAAFGGTALPFGGCRATCPMPRIALPGAPTRRTIPLPSNGVLYQRKEIVTPMDRLCFASGRRRAAGDVGHRQGSPTPSDAKHRRPERRLVAAFGPRRVRLAMPHIASTNAPSQKPLQAVHRSHYFLPLVLGKKVGRRQTFVSTLFLEGRGVRNTSRSGARCVALGG